MITTVEAGIIGVTGLAAIASYLRKKGSVTEDGLEGGGGLGFGDEEEVEPKAMTKKETIVTQAPGSIIIEVIKRYKEGNFYIPPVPRPIPDPGLGPGPGPAPRPAPRPDPGLQGYDSSIYAPGPGWRPPGYKPPKKTPSISPFSGTPTGSHPFIQPQVAPGSMSRWFMSGTGGGGGTMGGTRMPAPKKSSTQGKASSKSVRKARAAARHTAARKGRMAAKK